jgi:RNA polymerase sigma-70 factor (ECF subfamily)
VVDDSEVCVELEDSQLVARSREGDLAAFNVIVERYQAQVLSVAWRVVGTRASAEDITQETFISAYRAIGKFRGGSLRAWLFRIASNLGVDFLRSSKRRPEDSLDQSLEPPAFQVASGDETPEQAALRGELGGEIQKAILSLPDDQRVALLLIDVQGLSYDEAAEATGASVDTVKSRLSRARGKVRDILVKRPELLPDKFRHIG